MFKRFILIILCLIVLAFGYNLSKKDINALDKTKLSEQDSYFVGLTEYLSSLDFEVSEPITEEKKFDIFLIMCSRKEYAVETEDFYNEENETYQIPLDYINKIVTEHLPCEEIDTAVLVEESEVFKNNYDKQSDTYETVMIGGYGGMNPTVLLDITKENNLITITLGKLDKKEYAKNNMVLKSKYIAKYKIENFEAKKYKILYICNE